jgi:sulfatase modifying factor 1
MGTLKKTLLFIFGAAAIMACSSSDHGELVGAENRSEWYPSEPYGMVFIPQGSFNMGNYEQDVPYTMTAPAKTVSVPSFYMDQTEITNNEYRQFVHWVRDSILRFRLADGLIEEYEYIDYADMDDPSYFEEYKALNYPDSMQRHLDWSPFLEWDTYRYPSAEYTEIVEGMYLPPEEQFLGGRMIDARQLNYIYFWMNKRKASRKDNRVLYDYNDEDQDGLYFSYRDYIKDSREYSDRSSFFEKKSSTFIPIH